MIFQAFFGKKLISKQLKHACLQCLDQVLNAFDTPALNLDSSSGDRSSSNTSKIHASTSKKKTRPSVKVTFDNPMIIFLIRLVVKLFPQVKLTR
jgi:hypothetical protein